MAFEATKREWSELYTFCRLLVDGQIKIGTPDAKASESYIPIHGITREEREGNRLYRFKGDDVIVPVAGNKLTIPRTIFGEIADKILSAMKIVDDTVPCPDGVEEFLDELQIYNIESKTQERINLGLKFWNVDAPATGTIIRSRLSRMLPLLDGGRAANIKYELSGMKFANPMVSKVNALDSPNAVVERMLLIEQLGGILKYADVSDKVFRANLSMIDLHFPRLLSEMLRTMQLDGIVRISELTAIMKQMNPLKIKDELINKHLFYEHKVKQLLVAATTGMRPAKIYTGLPSAIQGMILVDGKGTPLYYPTQEYDLFSEFLFKNTRFEKGDVHKDHYGTLEKENGILYFRLNTKIGLIKR